MSRRFVPLRGNRRGFTHSQIKVGARIEKREHNVGYGMGAKIARDHLREDPNYYRKLAKAGL